MGGACYVDYNLWVEPKFFGVDPENRLPIGLVWKGHVDVVIDTSGTQQSRVDEFKTICTGKEVRPTGGCHAVELCK